MPELDSIRMCFVWDVLRRYFARARYDLGNVLGSPSDLSSPGYGTGRASPGKTGVNGSHLEGGSARTKKETGVAVGGDQCYLRTIARHGTAVPRHLGDGNATKSTFFS